MNGWQPVENHPALAHRGFALAYPLRRDERVSGVLLIDAVRSNTERRHALGVGSTAGQVAVAVEDCRLVEETLRWKENSPERERLAALANGGYGRAQRLRTRSQP